MTSLSGFAAAQKVVSWGSLTSVPAGLHPAKVDAGMGYSLALNPDGTVVGWGNAFYGQADIPAGLIAKDISAGAFSAFALRLDGSVAAWGSDNFDMKSVPDGLVATQVSGGALQAAALRTDGSVSVWGAGFFGQLDVPAGLVATQISCAVDSVAAIRADGSVVGWGNYVPGPADLRLKAVDGGGSFYVGIRPDGTVAVWGYGDFGELDVPAGLTATQVSGGHFHVLALRPNGTVAAWGRNFEGQTSVPAGLTGVLQVSAGEDHSLALVAAAHCLLDQTAVFAGGSATGTVKLADPAPSGGLVVGLQSDDATVHVPDSVTIPEGETSRTFPVTTDYAVGTRTAKIRTVYGFTDNERRTVPFALKVKGEAVVAGLSQTSLIGGSTTRPSLTVTIANPAPIDLVFALSTSDPSVIAPATATIPAGGTSFKVTLPAAGLVSAPTAVNVVASYRGAPAVSTILTVQPLKALVTFESATVGGGESTTGFVTTSAPVAQALTIPLSSSLSGVTVPASVTVKAGARTALFPITTLTSAPSGTTAIAGTIAGNAYSANLRILAAPSVKSLNLGSSIYGGAKLTGTVRLTMAAKAGGTVVTLSADPSLFVPATVTVPEGQYAVTFPVIASDVATTTSGMVTATAGAGSASAGVTVQPMTLASLALSTSTAASGAVVSITVTLHTTVAVDTPVLLSSQDGTLVPVPATITVPAGSRSVTVQVTLGSATMTKYVRITASKHASSQYKTLKVTP